MTRQDPSLLPGELGSSMRDRMRTVSTKPVSTAFRTFGPCFLIENTPRHTGGLTLSGDRCNLKITKRKESAPCETAFRPAPRRPKSLRTPSPPFSPPPFWLYRTVLSYAPLPRGGDSLYPDGQRPEARRPSRSARAFAPGPAGRDGGFFVFMQAGRTSSRLAAPESDPVRDPERSRSI